MEGILVTILKGLFVLVALIMTFFVLLQEGKGGGLAGLGGTKAAGVEGVTNPIRRATAVLSIIFFMLAILLGILARPSAESKRDKLFDAEAPVTQPGLEPGVDPEAPMPVLKKPADKATDKPADKATDKPAEKATDKPAEKATDKPAEKATDKPAEKATDKPAEKATDKPAEKKAE